MTNAQGSALLLSVVACLVSGCVANKAVMPVFDWDNFSICNGDIAVGQPIDDACLRRHGYLPRVDEDGKRYPGAFTNEWSAVTTASGCVSSVAIETPLQIRRGRNSLVLQSSDTADDIVLRLGPPYFKSDSLEWSVFYEYPRGEMWIEHEVSERGVRPISFVVSAPFPLGNRMVSLFNHNKPWPPPEWTNRTPAVGSDIKAEPRSEKK